MMTDKQFVALLAYTIWGDDTMSDELELAALLDCAVSRCAPVPAPAHSEERP